MKKASAQPSAVKVVMEAEVARRIRQHCRTSMKAEVCGVLIGTEHGTTTSVAACIAGVNAAQGGAHVTFTQDTWEHIYKVKDEQYPNERIVGWYHSHPGFGVFLSDHDTFIQTNFFSSPQQIAWVYDPHTDEEGCFGWKNGVIAKIDDVAFRFEEPVGESTANKELKAEEVQIRARETNEDKSISNLIFRVFTYIFALTIGAASSMWYIQSRFLIVSPAEGEKLLRATDQMGRDLDACVMRLRQLGALPAESAPVGNGSTPAESAKGSKAAATQSKEGSNVRPK